MVDENNGNQVQIYALHECSDAAIALLRQFIRRRF